MANGSFANESYIGLGLGGSYVNPPPAPGSLYSITDSSDFNFNVQAGYRFYDRFMAEVFYNDMGAASVVHRSSPDTVLGGITYKSIGANVNVSAFKDSSSFNIFAKAGMNRLSIAANDSRIAFTQVNNNLFSYGVGGSWQFADDWFLRADYDSFANDAKSFVVGIERSLDFKKRKAIKQSKADAEKYLDSDNDGIVDLRDQCKRTAPNTLVDLTGCPITTPTKIDNLADIKNKMMLELAVAAETLHFETNSDRLSPESYNVMTKIGAILHNNPELKLTVFGHADSTGSEQFNDALSSRRAKRVRAYIVALGIDADRVDWSAKGELEPLANNTQTEGRNLNRRVGFAISD